MKLKLNVNSGKGTGHRLVLVMVVKMSKLACRIILIVGEFILHCKNIKLVLKTPQ